MWRKQVEQWRQYVIWEGRDIPPDLLLSIIQHESGGYAGRRALVQCKSGVLPKMDGSTVTLKNAYGLTQVIPSTVAWYNSIHKTEPAYFEDISGTNERAARLQIRIGAWLIAHNVAMLNKYDSIAYPGKTPGTATPEQLGQALIAYAIGLGALKKKLAGLREKGVRLTQDNLHEHYPLWGYSKTKSKWINRPLHYAAVVWRNYERNKTNDPGTDPPQNPTGQPETVIAKKKEAPSYAVPVLLLIGVFVASKFFGKKE